MKKTYLITTFLLAASPLMYAATSYLGTYDDDGTTKSLTEGSLSVVTTSTEVTNVATDYSLGIGVFSPESSGVVPAFSIQNDGGGGTDHTFTATGSGLITQLHIYGFLFDPGLSISAAEAFTLTSGWDVSLSGSTLSRDVIVDGVGGATSPPGPQSDITNEGQAHATITFDHPVSSVTVTERGTASESVRFQFTLIPEPSTSVLLSLGGLALILHRKK